MFILIVLLLIGAPKRDFIKVSLCFGEGISSTVKSMLNDGYSNSRPSVSRGKIPPVFLRFGLGSEGVTGSGPLVAIRSLGKPLDVDVVVTATLLLLTDVEP